jgi:uracil phosphoribosyltransferase
MSLQLFYAKLPSDIATRQVILVDPMLATAGSACAAMDVLAAHGVKDVRS